MSRIPRGALGPLVFFALVFTASTALADLTIKNAALSGKEVTATVVNTGSEAVAADVIGLYNDGNRIQEVTVGVKVSPGQSVPVVLRFKGSAPSTLTITDDINPQATSPSEGEVAVGIVETPDPIE